MSGVSTYAVLHYVGVGFAGWQRQQNARTVQGDFETMLERLVGQRVVTHAAGRTDAGVHALGQVVSFCVPAKWEPGVLARALRGVSPADLWVKHVRAAPDGFHARRHATSRLYRYVLGADEAARSPFRCHFEWAYRKPLDWEQLKETSSAIRGTHSFQAFSVAGKEKPHYRCQVLEAAWQQRTDAEGFIFSIEADRFLHRMVRFLVGTMVDIGSSRRPAEDIRRLLTMDTNEETSPPAPPEGLYMLGARYPNFDEVHDR